MDFKSYFTGWRLEHFSGWGETTSPLFGTADTSMGISLLDAPTNPKLGRGCLWAEFRDPDTRQKTTLNEIWAGAFFYMGVGGSTTPFVDTNNPVMVFHSSNPGKAICLVSTSARDGTYTKANTWKVFLAPNLYDQSTFVDTGILIENFTSASSTADVGLYFHIENAGTPYGGITVAGLTPTTMSFRGSWNGDLTEYSDFHAVSFHSGGQMTGKSYVDIRPLWLVIANANINYSTLQIDVGTKQGTLADWTGGTASFPIYPVATANINGLYSDATSQTVTFSYGKTVVAKDGYTVGAVFTSAAVNTDSSMTDAALDGVVYDPVQKRTALQNNPASVSADGNAAVWTYIKDPISGNHWTPDLVNAYEYGTRRTT